MKKKLTVAEGNLRTAIFAGGCFWCLEAHLEQMPGVLEVENGYTGGESENPRHSDVGKNQSGHREAVRVSYDVTKVSYDQLLDAYWQSIDPTDDGGQYGDRGGAYLAAIYVASRSERETAKASKQRLIESGAFTKPIVVPILDETTFWPAKSFHQDYYIKRHEEYQDFLRFSRRPKS